MRKSLLTAAAVAPLILMIGAPALAETDVSGARTTPIATATANNGQPDDVVIPAGASIVVSGPVAATLNSNNTLTNNGAIGIKDVDGSAGVVINGGNTGAFNNQGAITITESYTPTDTNNDGVVDGVYAQGTGRYGVRVIAPGAFVGNITAGGGSTISVQGNNSYGVSIETPVQGSATLGGGITVTGNNTVAVRETSGITGPVVLNGSIGAVGGGAVGADFTGDIGGRLSLYGPLQSTGYRATTRASDPAVNAALLPADLLQSGSALQIRANVGGGVFVGAPPATTVATDTTTDADGDGIVDSLEAAGSITTFGQAPALLVGADGRDVHLGAVGSGANAFGLIIRGNVLGNGVFDNNSGTGIQIGTGAGTVHIDGGLRLVGALVADGYQANATGIHLESGAVVPTLQIENTLSTTGVSTLATSSTGILIDAGASTTTLNNTGSINASLNGDLGSAYAVVDKSGTLSNVLNDSQIAAVLTPTSSADTVAGKAIALDLSANTTGVTLSQVANPNSTTTAPITPTIVGDILLGSGNDNVQFLAGNVTGALAFSSGTDSILINGGAVYRGALTSSGTLAVNVNNGTLQDLSPTTVHLPSLNVGANGVLIISADPAHNTTTVLNVAGPATIAPGGKLGVQLNSLPTGPTSYTVITSPSLSVASSDTDLTGETPYLFVTNFHANQTAGTVTLDIRRRTAAEAGLKAPETAAFQSVYDSLPIDPGISQAFLAQTSAPGLVGVLDQMLPDYAGGVFRTLAWASEARGIAAGEPPIGEDQQGPTRAWTQEIVRHEQKDPTQTAGYNTLGIGAVGGLESVSAHGDAVGARFGFTSSNISNPALAGDNLLSVSELNAGVYWRGNLGGLRADLQVGAGYVWLRGRREFLYSDAVSGSVVHRTANGSWGGYTLSGRAGLAYSAKLGALFLEPRVHVDYFRDHESGYDETGGGNGYDLAVDGRSGDMLSVTGSVTAGANFGSDGGFRWRPQIEAGYRAVVSGSAGTTTASIDGGTPFSLAAQSLRNNALIGRVGVRVYSDYLDLLLDAGTEYNQDYTDIDVHLTARTVF